MSLGTHRHNRGRCQVRPGTAQAALLKELAQRGQDDGALPVVRCRRLHIPKADGDVVEHGLGTVLPPPVREAATRQVARTSRLAGSRRSPDRRAASTSPVHRRARHGICMSCSLVLLLVPATARASPWWAAYFLVSMSGGVVSQVILKATSVVRPSAPFQRSPGELSTTQRSCWTGSGPDEPWTVIPSAFLSSGSFACSTVPLPSSRFFSVKAYPPWSAGCRRCAASFRAPSTERMLRRHRSDASISWSSAHRGVGCCDTVRLHRHPLQRVGARQAPSPRRQSRQPAACDLGIVLVAAEGIVNARQQNIQPRARVTPPPQDAAPAPAAWCQ